MERIVIYIIASCLLSSCKVEVGKMLVNEKGTFSDVDEYIIVPDSMFAVKEFYHIEKKTYVSIDGEVRVVFGLNAGGRNDNDIQTYNGSDSLYPRIKYHFIIPTPVLPTVKLNAFSFTDKKGNAIPCILYYRTVDNEVRIIDSLPVVFINEDAENMLFTMFRVYAECCQSYASTKTIYINYDIEVGNKHFVRQIKYRRKNYVDWRPKFW